MNRARTTQNPMKYEHKLYIRQDRGSAIEHTSLIAVWNISFFYCLFGIVAVICFFCSGLFFFLLLRSILTHPLCMQFYAIWTMLTRQFIKCQITNATRSRLSQSINLKVNKIFSFICWLRNRFAYWSTVCILQAIIDFCCLLHMKNVCLSVGNENEEINTGNDHCQRFIHEIASLCVTFVVVDKFIWKSVGFYCAIGDITHA